MNWYEVCFSIPYPASEAFYQIWLAIGAWWTVVTIATGIKNKLKPKFIVWPMFIVVCVIAGPIPVILFGKEIIRYWLPNSK